MVLADLGADVVQVRRPNGNASPDGIADADAGLWRGKRIVEADLKNLGDLERIREIISAADVLIEGYRPGVMERIGLGPDTLGPSMPRLIYARMTGWGQTGSHASAAGHDINYLAATGVLDAMGPTDLPPVPPLSLVGDFGGGSMLLVVGVLSALHERHRSGMGQILDVAMTDGASLLAQLQWSWRAAGRWVPREEKNVLDGSAPFYTTYACSSGCVAVGALEDTFWEQLLQVLGLLDLPDRWDRSNWPAITAALQLKFATRSRDDWVVAFAGVDACVSPVYTFDEAAASGYAQERASFVTVGGTTQPAPAPRFSRSEVQTPLPPTTVGIASIIDDWFPRR